MKSPLKFGAYFELLTFAAAWICGLAIATGTGRESPRPDRVAEAGHDGRVAPTAMK